MAVTVDHANDHGPVRASVGGYSDVKMGTRHC